jgi:hypothetical protein
MQRHLRRPPARDAVHPGAPVQRREHRVRRARRLGRDRHGA